MAGYKDYRSVSEFPLTIDQLDRPELEAVYQDLRKEYKSLTTSRGQLVRRNTEMKTNLVAVQQRADKLQAAIARLNAEKQSLQGTLAHSEDVRQYLQKWGDDLAVQVDDLSTQLRVTTNMLEEFETAYEEVQTSTGFLSLGERFFRLLQAAKRLLSLDLRALKQPSTSSSLPPKDDWTEETPDTIGRSLRDGQG
jgi:chromosome segregation ATPase